MFDPHAIYDIWAPSESPWSPWAKPVLFAHLHRTPLSGASLPTIRLAWKPTDYGRCALVVELPGVDSVSLGLDLAAAGFRPVPLFNACPAPAGQVEVVPVTPILAALSLGAQRLEGLEFHADAPPAFLLDSGRRGYAFVDVTEKFDNRSVTFATDFPSATFLFSQGIERAIVIHSGRIDDDLNDVLRGWQRGGIPLFVANYRRAGVPEPLSLPPAILGPFSRMARRLWGMINLRRHPLGGFGGFVPEASSSG